MRHTVGGAGVRRQAAALGGGWPQSPVVAVKFDLESNSNRFKTNPNQSNFDRLKNDLPSSKKLN
jgi:hypothetical protein